MLFVVSWRVKIALLVNINPFSSVSPASSLGGAWRPSPFLLKNASDAEVAIGVQEF